MVKVKLVNMEDNKPSVHNLSGPLVEMESFDEIKDTNAAKDDPKIGTF